MNFDLPKVNLKAFALQQYLASRGEDFVRFVNQLLVDLNLNLGPATKQFHFRPFPHRAFDIVLPAGIEQFLKVGIVLVPPELATRKDFFSPPGDQRGRLSGPRIVSLVICTGMTVPAASLPRMQIKSPLQPWASWHSIDAIQTPLAAPSGPVPCSRTPLLRTYFPPSVFFPHLYSSVRR